MRIREFDESDIEGVVELVKRTFLEFNARSFTEEGVEEFINNTGREYFEKKDEEGDVFVAEEKGGIMGGVVSGNGSDKINNLFVDSDNQGRGVGRELMERMENLYKGRGAEKLKVRSSLYAVDFYESQGYKKTRGVVKRNDGFVYQPMQKEV